MENATKCIYCFKEFLPINAHFRAKSPIVRFSKKVEIAEDDFIEDIKKDFDDGREVDIYLKNYYKTKLNYDDKTAESFAMQYPFFKKENEHIVFNTAKDEITGREYIKEIFFENAFYDTADLSTNERICPHCHNKLPKGFGIKDTVVISLIGDTFSGKTVYLTVLLNELINRKDYFKGSLVERGDKNDLRLIKSYHKKLFEDKELPESTPLNVSTPLLYNYTYTYLDKNKKSTKKSIDIVLYDIAGENCREDEKLEEKGYNVKNSDGIIFLINPLAINNIKNYFKAYDIVTQDTNTSSQLEIINAIYQNFLSENNKKSTIPTALVISKADVFSNSKLNLPFFETHPNSLIKTDNYDDSLNELGYISKEDLLSLNHDVKIFLEDMGAVPFVNAIENYFEKYGFFVISALNQTPVEKNIDEKIIGIIEKDIKPFRVTDPFYWILCQNNHLNMFSKSDFIQFEPKKKDNFFKKLFNKK